MPNGAPESGQNMRELRRALLGADDRKIRQIVAMLDELPNPAVNQGILDPIRARVASLHPPRRLRFTRLLFIPLAPLLVPARDWKTGDPALPRSVLGPFSRVVQAGLGTGVLAVQKLIAGHKSDAARAITLAGDLLWPQAAEILAGAPAPDDWAETGLRPEAFIALAKATAAVLRRAPQLRCLARAQTIGALEPDAAAVNEILLNIENEPVTGRTMIVQLVLMQSPHAVTLLRQIVASGGSAGEKASLRQAIADGTAGAIDALDSGSGFLEEIATGSLSDAGDGARRIIALLGDLELDGGSIKNRSRLSEVRQKLDQACRTRFADGLRDGLVTPLADAAGPMDGAGQTQLEACARDLRVLETAARTVGDAAGYDRLLRSAAEAVETIEHLSPVRKLRLVEILSGPEAAEALYSTGR
jgi:hypothetical protein